MSLGAWIFLSVVVFVFGPLLISGILLYWFWRRGKRFMRDVGDELEKALKEFEKE